MRRILSKACRHHDWDGRPDEPEHSGWHWIEDGDGLRPLFWRGGDWPEQLDRNEWQDGFAVLSPHDLARHGIYYGPLVMPPAIAARFRDLVQTERV